MRIDGAILLAVSIMMSSAMACSDDTDDLNDTNTTGGKTGGETGGETGNNTGGEAIPPSEFLGVDQGEWSYIANDDMKCMNGSKTGFGVRINDDSRKLMIQLQDGGACFNSLTCLVTKNADGFGESDMTKWSEEEIQASGIFDSAMSPFSDYSVVFVPYCGGDVHGGQNASGPAGRVHKGYANVTAVLNDIVPAFSGQLDKVILSGASAGALGVLLNYEQTAKKFDDVPVDLLSDSGQVLADDVLAPCLQDKVRNAWNLTPSVPAGCTDCTAENGGGLTNIYEYLAKTYPERKFSILSTTADLTFRQFYYYAEDDCSKNGIGTMSGIPFRNGVYAWANRLSTLTNMNIYVHESSRHVLTYGGIEDTESRGIQLKNWLTDFETGDVNWSDVIPIDD